MSFGERLSIVVFTTSCAPTWRAWYDASNKKSSINQIQTANLINLKVEIAKGIKDVKCGRVKKMDIHAIKQKARSLHK